MGCSRTRRLATGILIATALAAVAFLCWLFMSYCSGRAQTVFAVYLDGSGSLLEVQQRNLVEILSATEGRDDCEVIVCLDRGVNPPAMIAWQWAGCRVFRCGAGFSETLVSPLQSGVPQSMSVDRFEKICADAGTGSRELIQRSYHMQHDRYLAVTLTQEQEILLQNAWRKAGYVFLDDLAPDAPAAVKMRAFFAHVRDNYAGTRYVWLISGHGSGWFDAGDRPGDRAFVRADLPLHAQILRDVCTGNRPDILYADMCYMAQLETIYELRNAADWLILWQGVAPAQGHSFAGLFERQGLVSPDAAVLAHNLCDHAAGVLKASRLDSALVLVRPAAGLVEYADAFQQAAERCDAPDVKAALNRMKPFATADVFLSQHADLAEVEQLLRDADPGFRAQKNFVTGVYSNKADMTGISVYFPVEQLYTEKMLTQYRGLEFFTRGGEKGWPRPALERVRP